VPLLRDIAVTDLSPYLAQHVDNPVDWWTWGEDALAEAARLDHPIFLSVGYAACHWCHVMAHESFEDPAVAAVLNRDFLAIKVDREERPDLDQLYMAATQLIAGHGGWPMSVFLLPDGRPFTAGTYYPPVDRHGQVGFVTLLHAITAAWTTRRADVEQQARALERSLAREVGFVDHLAVREEPFSLAGVRRSLAAEVAASTDELGGQGAPRFPRPSFVDALWRAGDAESLAAGRRILDAMGRRGLFDHVGGGFARYSVDAQWRVPHFEKMLSDQALLARAYFRAASCEGPPSPYEDVARRTVDFVRRDLAVAHGYGASLDADAARVEGSHITWTREEVDEALGPVGLLEHAAALSRRLLIGPPGDLDGRSVPRLGDDEPWRTPDELVPALRALFDARARRPQPARDTKVILEWNAMFASALLSARDDELTRCALDLLTSLADSHFARGHWWRTESRRDFATAADVAWLVDATVDAFEATADDDWLARALEGAHYLVEHYWDGPVPSVQSPHVGSGVFATSDECQDLFTRPKEIFDGATPSSHAIATRALARVALCRGDQDLMTVAERLVELGAELLATHPRAVIDLVEAAGFVHGVEVVVPGELNDLSRHVRSLPMLRGVLVTGSGSSPLLAGREEGLAYVCERGVCQRPVDNVADLAALLDGVH
jgi:uncharacterized protein YyaL (SSP411 family)